jgi:DNA-directed RNA polymerase specialized sigma24 family protein
LERRALFVAVVGVLEHPDRCRPIHGLSAKGFDVSIVAERPVIPQGAGRVQDRSNHRSRAERDRVRPVVTERTPDRLIRSGYTTGDRVSLRVAVDVPLGSEQAERVGRLAALHGGRLERYLCVRLGWDRRALAQDLAQDVWVEMCRPGALAALGDRADEEAFPFLAGRAKWAIGQHFAAMPNRCEAPVSLVGEDDTVERALERLAAGCTVLAAAPEATELTGRFGEAVAKMPEDLRLWAHLRFELGMSTRAIEDLTGWPAMTVYRRGQTVVALLHRVADGEDISQAVPEKQAGELPDGYEGVLDQLPDHYRAVVRLRAEGLSNMAIAARIGYTKGGAGKLVAKAVKALKAALRDIGAAVDQDAPARRTAELPDGWESVVGELPEDLRAVVALHEQGLSYSQIGERLGYSKPFAGERFRRACARLEALVRIQAREAVMAS